MPSLIHKRSDGSDHALEFSSKPLVVGRVAESDILVRDSFVSRVHCGFVLLEGKFILKDLGSTNGTYRNGARVFECTLAPGDKVQVGNTTLIFEIDKASGNALVRQVPQMVAPPSLLISNRPAAMDRRLTTAPVEKPAPPTPPAAPPPGLRPG